MPLVDLWTALVLIAVVVAVSGIIIRILSDRHNRKKREMKQKHELDKMLLTEGDDD